MTESFTLNNCSEQDVLLFGSTLKVEWFKRVVVNHFSTVALGKQITESLKNQHIPVSGIETTQLQGQGYLKQTFYDKWFLDGVDCEILKLGAPDWQKGKIRINLNISLEFCPDEPELESTPASDGQAFSQPESPLDDIRRMITNG